MLRPGGRAVLADFRCTEEYAATLTAAGLCDVSRRRLGPDFWYGGPWAATRVVTAQAAGDAMRGPRGSDDLDVGSHHRFRAVTASPRGDRSPAPSTC